MFYFSTLAALFSVLAASLAGCASKVNSLTDESKLAMGEVGSDQLSRVRPIISTGGMVVSDDRIASEWGAEILRHGGNAVDAAVATAFMLAVTRPHYGSLGGGGFMVYCPKNAECTTLDYREKAPKLATSDMYVRNGKAQSALSQDGALASGVPGVTAGLLAALEKFGTQDRRKLLSEPIRVAKNGFRFTGWEESTALSRWDALNADAKAIIGCKSSSGLKPCPVGTVVRQHDLAKVLGQIAESGRDGFYKGWVAGKIVKAIQSGGGILSLDDLKAYEPSFQKALVGSFHGHQVVTMPPPSSGGVLLLQMLQYMNRAEKAGLLSEGFGSTPALHAESHAMSLAFADRSEYLGDQDFVKVPVEKLLNPAYLDERWKSFSRQHANPPEGPGKLGGEPHYTTHFSVVDRDGNAVAITTTINDEFGSGFVPAGTGVFMNDEMDDFSSQPGVPNLFGLVGGSANAIAPGKRPLSSMTPTIVRDQSGNVELVLGAAGGPRIITSVFNVLMDRYIFGMSLPDAVAAPRVHDQWKPGEILVESYGFAPEVIVELKAMGYVVNTAPELAEIHAIERFSNGRTWGVPDPRGEGAAIGE